MHISSQAFVCIWQLGGSISEDEDEDLELGRDDNRSDTEELNIDDILDFE